MSLLVRGLPRDASVDEIRDRFSKYGQVEDVYIPKDYHTKMQKQFAFVQFLDGREEGVVLFHSHPTRPSDE